MQTQTPHKRNPKDKKLPFYRIEGSRLTSRASFRLPKKDILSRYPLRKKSPELHPASLQARKRIFTNELGELTQSVLKEKKDTQKDPLPARDRIPRKERPALASPNEMHTKKSSERQESSSSKTSSPTPKSLETNKHAVTSKKTDTASQAQSTPKELPHPTLPEEKAQIQIKDELGLEENLESKLLSELEKHESKAKDIPDLIIEDFDYQAAGLEKTARENEEKPKAASEDRHESQITSKPEEKPQQTDKTTKGKDLPETIASPQELSIGITEFQEDYLIEEEPSFLSETTDLEEKKTSISIPVKQAHPKDISEASRKPKKGSKGSTKASPSPKRTAKKNPQVDWLKYEWHPEKNSLYYELASIYKKSVHEEKDFAFLIEHIRKEAGAAAAAIVLFNEEKTVYQRILDSGLDEITARNLYFGIQDAYVNPEMQGKKIPLLHGDSRDFYFQKRFSSDFFHSTNYFTVHNLLPLGFDGYLLLFYRQKDEKPKIFSALEGLLSDSLPLIHSFAQKSWYASANEGEMHSLLQRLIFENLRKASKGGKKSIWVYHLNLTSLLKSPDGYHKVQTIYKTIEKDLAKQPSVFLLQLLPHRFVLFGESKEELEIYIEEVLRLSPDSKIEIRSSLYPADGENLFNYIAAS